MKTKKMITGILVLILIILTPLISATSINIDMKDSFNLDEEVSFKYIILSEQVQEIEYIVSVNCPNAPLPLLEIKTASLEANAPFTETYTYMSVVNENIEPQTCTAGVNLLSPEEILEKKSFEIITNPSFGFNILTCKDSNCAEQTKIFILNQDIYLDYTSEVSEPIITATLTSPDNSVNQLDLSTSIKAEQIGTYILEVKASKQGYKTNIKKTQFGVIEKESKIESVSICNSNGMCNNGENSQNCPQDCLTGKKDGLCDGYKDKICDPDCSGTDDPDCLISLSVKILYPLIPSLLFVGIVSYIIHLEFSRRRKKGDLEKELELKNYIRNSLTRGYTKAQITQELIKDGWNEGLINKAFNSLGMVK
tara:strand:- start:617 stop:1714 length:1098 start_codon:yes stop_codon:yes gene_type:complete